MWVLGGNCDGVGGECRNRQEGADDGAPGFGWGVWVLMGRA